jgi:hypothetical protein
MAHIREWDGINPRPAIPARGQFYRTKKEQKKEQMKKTLIIFEVHLPIGTLSLNAAAGKIKETNKMLRKHFDSIQERTDYIFEIFVFPTTGIPKMECIFKGDKENYYPFDDAKGFSIDGEDEEEDYSPLSPYNTDSWHEALTKRMKEYE